MNASAALVVEVDEIAERSPVSMPIIATAQPLFEYASHLRRPKVICFCACVESKKIAPSPVLAATAFSSGAVALTISPIQPGGLARPTPT